VYTNIRFQPFFPKHGVWYLASEAFVHANWTRNKAYPWDYAILYFGDGIPLQYFPGIASDVNWGRSSPCPLPIPAGCYRGGAQTYGYPADPPFDGSWMYRDESLHSCSVCGSGELVFKIIGLDGWDLTGGASGGPWINTDQRAGGLIYPPPIPSPQTGQIGPRYNIQGLNSFTFEGNPGEIWSPQFLSEKGDLQTMYAEIVQTRPR
jgi:hypothetical protein